jgi:hypothetical protein
MKEVIWEHLKDFLVIELKLLYSILIPLSAGFVSGIEEGRDGGIGATTLWDASPPTFGQAGTVPQLLKILR